MDWGHSEKKKFFFFFSHAHRLGGPGNPGSASVALVTGTLGYRVSPPNPEASCLEIIFSINSRLAHRLGGPWQDARERQR
jgi:hypothetical protein